MTRHGSAFPLGHARVVVDAVTRSRVRRVVTACTWRRATLLLGVGWHTLEELHGGGYVSASTLDRVKAALDVVESNKGEGEVT